MNSLVKVHENIGRIRFIGETQFAPGNWVGVELNAPKGKNDGRVAGIKYFECQPLHGIFVRPHVVKLVAKPSAPISPRENKDTCPKSADPVQHDGNIGLEKLKRRLLIVESKRLRDQEQINNLLAENRKVTKLNNQITQLQLKLQSTNDELQSLRTQVRDESQSGPLISYNEEDVEKLLMDREIAEANLESLSEQLKGMTSRFKELEQLCDTLQRENSIYADNSRNGDSGESGALKVRINRLEEALLQLKADNESQSKELSQYKQKIQDAEIRLADQSRIKADLIRAQQAAVDLRSQLDATLGAEAVLEELTERNLILTEKNQLYESEIQQLKALKDLSDELEESHMIQERELQDEISVLNSRLADRSDYISDIEQRKSYLESAMLSLRDTIAQLQNEIELLKKSASETLQTTTSESSAVIQPDNDSSQNFVMITDSNYLITQNLAGAQLKIAQEHLSMVEGCVVPGHFARYKRAISTFISLRKVNVLLSAYYDYFLDCSVGDAMLNSQICQLSSLAAYLAESLCVGSNAAKDDEFEAFGNFKESAESVEMSLRRNMQDLLAGKLAQQQCLRSLEVVLSQLQVLPIRPSLIGFIRCILAFLKIVPSVQEFKGLQTVLDEIQAQESNNLITVPDNSLDDFLRKATRELTRENVLSFAATLGQLLPSSYSFVETPIPPWVRWQEQVLSLANEQEKALEQISAYKNRSQTLARELAERERKVEELEVQIEVSRAKINRAQEKEGQFEALRKTIEDIRNERDNLKTSVEALNKQNGIHEALISQYQKAGALWQTSQELSSYSNKKLITLHLESEILQLQRALDYMSLSNTAISSPLVLVPRNSEQGSDKGIPTILVSHRKYFQLVREECGRQCLSDFKNPQNSSTLWRKIDDSPAVRAMLSSQRLTRIKELLQTPKKFI